MTPAGPDEATYLAQARTIREYGIRRGFRLLADRFSPHLPSPLRWLWILAVAATYRISPRFWPLASLVACPLLLGWAVGNWVAVALAATSPLLLLLGRRALQDAPVAALVIACLGFAVRGDAVGLGLTLFALLAVKEAAALYVPAFALIWSGAWLPFAVAALVASVLVALVWFALFGRGAVTMFRRAAGGHDTDYAQQHQRGGAHRLIVDLALVSPSVVLCAFAAVKSASLLLLFVIAVLVAHTFAPIQNVRFVVAVDLVLRSAVATLAPLAVLATIAVDLVIAWRIRHVYDPVTQSLAHALGMPSPTSTATVNSR